MSAELRSLKAHDHPCLIYETKEEQVAAFVPYLQAGLVQGEKCVYIVDDSDPSWVVESMRASSFPIDEYSKSGAFSVITKEEAYLLQGHFDTNKMCDFWAQEIMAANEAGFPALRAAAEMTWALSNQPGCEQLVCYESHLNNVFPMAKVSALCQYNRKRFTAQVIKDMIHVHPLVVVGGEVIDNPGFIPPEQFIESHAEMDVQALIDNLTMTKKLAQSNAQLREALEAQERALQTIQERNLECESLYQELQSLAKVVSHEMQAPLNVMQSYLRLIAVRYKSKLGADADEFIDKSVTAARVVGKMADDLWNYARVDTQHNGSIDDLDSAEVLGEALHGLQDSIDRTSAHIELVTRLPVLRASREHLRYLFNALIANSIKYARSGIAPDIKVGSEEDAASWLFFVRDNGCGIDEVHSLDVFKLFNRLQATPGEDGTGMGLSICKRILDQYKGKIWFDSNHGHGATFWFSIPKNEFKANNVTDIRDYAASKMRDEIAH